ncbi:hypothetical protein B0T10DRAFT_218220 [Thelonectria olida]|uniref:Uncharacterized protein n=1 Tax=Thelonectria olida TaxID=1576542 RepID=A0A9P8WCR2_9HYPO|nr:hypothetical protein B0T10DRAFT_218220 [Thelonectria olida]
MGNDGCDSRTTTEMNAVQYTQTTKVWPGINANHDAYGIYLPVTSAYAAPPVPPRHASLQRSIRVRRSSASADVARNSPGQGSPKDISVSKWENLAPLSSAQARRRPSSCVTNKGSAGVGLQSPARPDEEADFLGGGLWKKRSLGAETFRGLFPAKADLSTAAREQEASRSGPVRDTSLPQARMKKDAGRWGGWGAWF